MKIISGQTPIEQFDASDFNDAVTGTRIETGCFSIEDDLAHSAGKNTGLTSGSWSGPDI
jgi:hypothetical protein